MSQLKLRFIQGVSWSLFSRVLSQLIRITITIVLVRKLSPAEFGLIGMVTVLTGFANTLIDFGLGSALIQKNVIDDIEKSSVFWFNLIMSIIISITYMLLSGFISDFYGEPKLYRITLILSSLFIINASALVNRAILQKNLEFKLLFKIGIISQMVSGSIAILLAYLGFSYWAIIYQIILSASISTALSFYYLPWRPKILIDFRALRKLLDFGWGVIGNNSLNYWVRNIDNLLIGKYIGSSDLGIYSKSYGILTLPVKNLSGSISKVLFPTLLKFKNDTKKINKTYFKVCNSILLFSMPLAIFIFVQAEDLIRILFGDKWLDMVIIVKIFTILSINQSIGTLITNLYMVHGKTQIMFKLGTFLRIILISGIVIGLNWGIIGVAIGYTAASVISSIINHWYVGKISGFTLVEFIKNLLPIFLLNLLMLSFLLVSQVLLSGVLNSHFYILVSMVFYGLVYIFLLELFNNSTYAEVRSIIRSKNLF